MSKRKILIVFAHAEAKSFCAALKDNAIETFKKAGHEVKVSDLYKMKFLDPIMQSNFTKLNNPDFFKPQT